MINIFCLFLTISFSLDAKAWGAPNIERAPDFFIKKEKNKLKDKKTIDKQTKEKNDKKSK